LGAPWWEWLEAGSFELGFRKRSFALAYAIVARGDTNSERREG